MVKRAVITGAGTINPLGRDVSATFSAMVRGTSAIGPLDIPNADRLRIGIGAQVSDYDATRNFSEKQLSMLDRFSQFALIAAREAFAQSGLFSDRLEANRAGVIVGNAGGGMSTQDMNFKAVYAENKDRVHPFVVPRLMSNAPASNISIEFGLQGPAFGVSSACASANHALVLATQFIRAGIADVMLAGGSEAMLTFGGIKAWESLRVLSPTGCRPFSRDRDGMVMGEGAAIFVIEEFEHARKRGATILAEISGIAMNSDAVNMVRPDAASARRVMQKALDNAGLEPEDLDYINAHGTGTQANDLAEAQAISHLFAGNRRKPLVSSTKSLHGHLIGAASAVELLACILAIGHSTIAATAGTIECDPDCDIDLVIEQPVQMAVRHALSNAFAFGGLNASVVLSRL